MLMEDYITAMPLYSVRVVGCWQYSMPPAETIRAIMSANVYSEKLHSLPSVQFENPEAGVSTVKEQRLPGLIPARSSQRVELHEKLRRLSESFEVVDSERLMHVNDLNEGPLQKPAPLLLKVLMFV